MSDNKEGIGDKIMIWVKGLGLAMDYLKFTRRAALVMYGWFLYDTSQWFFALADPTTQQVTYVTAIIGLAGIIFGFYSNSPADYIKLDNANTRRRRHMKGHDSPPYYKATRDDDPDIPMEDDGFWDDTER